MNGLTRWEPFKELEDLHNRLANVFGRTPVRRAEGKENLTLADWAPLAGILSALKGLHDKTPGQKQATHEAQKA
jgi:hypothetical protein